MPDPNINNPENTSENTQGKTQETISSSSPPTSANVPVTEITADVDLTKKPASVKETINLLNDDELDKDVTKNTEGDIKKQAEAEKNKTNINDFRQQATQNPTSDKIFNPTLAEQQSEAWVKIVDMGMRFVLKLWSGQADNTGLEVSEPDKKVLAGQLAIALNEYKVVVPIILTVATTFGAMYATPIMNARDSKKKIDEFRAKQKAEEAKNVRVKPDLDAATGKHKKGKGRFFKT